MRQLYIDLDGVLADFDGHYSRTFNYIIDRNVVDPPNFWRNIEQFPRFYRTLPRLPDALELWEGAKRLHPGPIILTGIPESIPGVAQDKREWVDEHISPDAHMIACQSKHKRRYCKPGDVLIDDWIKYQHLWIEAGGIFILHTSAQTSLDAAQEFFL